jgi:folate-binding protein YgfZ
MAEHDSLAAAYAQARDRGGALDLSARAKWRLSGADRIRYLNGQVTNDIRRLERGLPDATLAACVTTAKGKLSGVVFVSAASDFLRIDADPELREPLTARLERYIIADDAALADTTDDECLFHLLGRATSSTPSIPAGCGEIEVRTANRLGHLGLDIIAPGAEHGRLLTAFTESGLLIPPAVAESLRIEAGVPRWGAELTEDTLPPEAGLDETAIDYNKGCYIGQEVISRIKSAGHVNRLLAGFTAATALAAGMTLHPDADPAKSAGEITSAAWSFGLDTWAGLGYLKRGFAHAALHARSPDGATVGVRIRDLPLIP